MTMMSPHKKTASSLIAAAIGLWSWMAVPSAAAASGEELLRNHCGACHQPTQTDAFARISSIRKTPEGWLMTISRMQHLHGVTLEEADRDSLVRYLADTQGLAPSETTPARFALERRPNAQDMTLPGELQALCARCHSAARVALQRRDADDWLKHVHWHTAQWPTIEYQQNARDREWWKLATTVAPAELGKLFPFHSQAWDDWKKRPPADLSGTWLVRGHKPGRGDYWGTAVIAKAADGDYEAVYSLDDAVGEHFDGRSKAILYTGFEWRGTGTLGARDTREVFAVAEDGQSMTGRWFTPTHPEDGSDWTAVRDGATARIVSLSPVAARIGETTRIKIYGSALAGTVNAGPGTKTKIISRSGNLIVADVTVNPDAERGFRTVTAGTASTSKQFAVYDRIDRLAVTPGFGIARVGGGKVEPVIAQYEANAYIDVAAANGATEAVNLGNLPVDWSVEPYDEEAKKADDVKFAGTIDKSGRFRPALAGPNPKRKFSANNAGNLAVVARLTDDAKTIVGKGRLVVTVQRWNTPPIY